MANEVELTVQVGTLAPSPSGETRQQFAEELASRLIVTLPSDNSTFVIGGSQPTSDEGPWFKEQADGGYELWVWNSTDATYEPLTLLDSQLRYILSTSAPDENTYNIWVEVNSDNKPIAFYTFNNATNAWENLVYSRDEIEAAIEGTAGDGKWQIAWDNITGKPDSVTTAFRSLGSGSYNWGTDASPDLRPYPKPAYAWEIIYHVDCARLLIYDSNNSAWKTLDGGIGDTLEVRGTTLGDPAHFTDGNFATILGKRPGWELDAASVGRSVVGADSTEVWDSTTTSKKEPESTYGADQTTLTEAQMPSHRHFTVADDTTNTNTVVTSSDQVQKSDNSVPGGQEYQLSGSSVDSTLGRSSEEGGDEAHSNVQKSIAYYRLRKVL